MTTTADQKRMFYDATRRAVLHAMNDRIRAIAPDEAWHPDNINDATVSELDALQDSISACLVRVQSAHRSN